jgi:hypothetical protein
MTIAAGFHCNDGVVISTDTLMTASPSKTHESKIHHWSFPGGKVGFALAGNVPGALCAIERVKRCLSDKTGNALSHIEKTLESEYKRQVIDLPEELRDDYSLLFVLWLPDGKARLYGAEGLSVYPIDAWEAIGIGMDLANFVIGQGHSPSRIYDALKLSSYTLSSIKDNVDGCGGMSVHLVTTNEGEMGIVTSLHGPSRDLQEYARTFDGTVRELLMQIATEGASNEQVEQYVKETFLHRILQNRSRWTASREQDEKNFAELPANARFTQDEVRSVIRRLSMGLPPIQRPLPVSRGGSDES